MLRNKMLAVMNELEQEVAERSELIFCIAMALLAKVNLFILGAPGQAKSYAVNAFCERITGARRFERLLSKQTDEEALFGRLDLSSLIPGAVPASMLAKDAKYQEMRAALTQTAADFAASGDEKDRQRLVLLTETIEQYRKTLSELSSGLPEIITTGKIPDAHICFIDEIYKANDGVLNSLLTALNERKYTNEGRVIRIPTISFFAASNEIPNFRNPEEQILAPLHDRFALKVQTQNIAERANRLEMLRRKQRPARSAAAKAVISLDELCAMQEEAAKVVIPEAINELMDDLLCTLRTRGITVSDRTFLNYGSVARAAAWLNGHSAVRPADLLHLKNYLWNEPQEIESIEKELARACANPLRMSLDALYQKAQTCLAEYQQNSRTAGQGSRAMQRFRAEMVRLYDEWSALKQAAGGADDDLLNASLDQLEGVSRDAHTATTFTYVTLPELKALSM